jgi:hypothetical protein
VQGHKQTDYEAEAKPFVVAPQQTEVEALAPVSHSLGVSHVLVHAAARRQQLLLVDVNAVMFHLRGELSH